MVREMCLAEKGTNVERYQYSQCFLWEIIDNQEDTNLHDWYIAFRTDYISGDPHSDDDENSEVIWGDVEEALCREDLPSLSDLKTAGSQ